MRGGRAYRLELGEVALVGLEPLGGHGGGRALQRALQTTARVPRRRVGTVTEASPGRMPATISARGMHRRDGVGEGHEDAQLDEERELRDDESDVDGTGEIKRDLGPAEVGLGHTNEGLQLGANSKRSAQVQSIRQRDSPVWALAQSQGSHQTERRAREQGKFAGWQWRTG